MADRGRGAAGPGRRHQVERAVRAGVLRPHDRPVGRRRAPHRGRAAPLPDGAAARSAVGVPVDGACGDRHVHRLLVGLVRASGTFSRARGWQHSGYFRHWAESPAGRRRHGTGGAFDWLLNPLRSLWHYETEVYKFHVGLDSPHVYQSNPWSWLVQSRPVSYFYESPRAGQEGCPGTPPRSAPARCWPWAPRCCGGRPASRCSTCSSGGRCGATGGRARSWPGSRPGICRGSSTRTARSSPSTPSCSCRSCVWRWP